RAARSGGAIPVDLAGLAAPVSSGRPDPANAAAPALRAERLPLPAPRPLRRAGIPLAVDRAPQRSAPRLQRRRVHAGRTTAAHAVAWRSRAAGGGRCGDLRRQRAGGGGG